MKAMLAMSAERGPTVRRRMRHSTGCRNLNVCVEVGMDISSCTSSGTLNSAARTVKLLNRDACVCTNPSKDTFQDTFQDTLKDTLKDTSKDTLKDISHHYISTFATWFQHVRMSFGNSLAFGPPLRAGSSASIWRVRASNRPPFPQFPGR